MRSTLFLYVCPNRIRCFTTGSRFRLTRAPSRPCSGSSVGAKRMRFGTIAISTTSHCGQLTPVLSVNWCELTVTRKSDGQVLYRNSWVTNHHLTPQRVIDVAAAGRCRWKTENENHNVLKTKGYHLDHNFGHGKQQLSAFLLTLNLLAFLFHTVLHMADERYQQIRQIRGTRQGFFQDILALTNYLWFESWSALLDFMLDQSKPTQPIRSNTS